MKKITSGHFIYSWQQAQWDGLTDFHSRSCSFGLSASLLYRIREQQSFLLPRKLAQISSVHKFSLKTTVSMVVSRSPSSISSLGIAGPEPLCRDGYMKLRLGLPVFSGSPGARDMVPPPSFSLHKCERTGDSSCFSPTVSCCLKHTCMLSDGQPGGSSAHQESSRSRLMASDIRGSFLLVDSQAIISQLRLSQGTKTSGKMLFPGEKHHKLSDHRPRKLSRTWWICWVVNR